MKYNKSDSRGVSPVVGVILMVAVTVILAAVIGSFVLDLGSNTNENPQAGVTFDEASNGEVTVSLMDAGNTDEIIVETAAGKESISNVGSSATVNSYGEDVTVVGVSDDKQSVIQSYTPDYEYGGNIHNVRQTVANTVHTHSSISAALSEVESGDTIVVHSGTYSSAAYSVETDGITIVGDGEPTIDAPSPVDGFNVEADNVTISGLTFASGIENNVVLNGNNSTVSLDNSHSVVDNGSGNVVTDTDASDDPSPSVEDMSLEDNGYVNIGWNISDPARAVDTVNVEVTAQESGRGYSLDTNNLSGSIDDFYTFSAGTDVTYEVTAIDADGNAVASKSVTDTIDGDTTVFADGNPSIQKAVDDTSTSSWNGNQSTYSVSYDVDSSQFGEVVVGMTDTDSNDGVEYISSANQQGTLQFDKSVPEGNTTEFEFIVRDEHGMVIAEQDFSDVADGANPSYND